MSKPLWLRCCVIFSQVCPLHLRSRTRGISAANALRCVCASMGYPRSTRTAAVSSACCASRRFSELIRCCALCSFKTCSQRSFWDPQSTWNTPQNHHRYACISWQIFLNFIADLQHFCSTSDGTVKGRMPVGYLAISNWFGR